MTPFSIRRLAAATLLVTVAACGDKITQSTLQNDERADGSLPSANSGPTPTLVATTGVGQSGDFTDPLGSARLGLQYRVAVNGTGFIPGADFVTHTMVITAGGAKLSVGMGIGVIPADGTVRAVRGGSCPSQYREMYDVVVSRGRTTESNHVQLGC